MAMAAAPFRQDLALVAANDQAEAPDLASLDVEQLTRRYRVMHGQLATVGHKSLDLAYRLGEVLEHVHGRIGSGKWIGWCSNEDLEKRTANRYIAFRRAVGHRDNLSRLPADTSVRGAMALLAEVKQPVPQTEGPVFPVATPEHIVLEVLDAGETLPDRVIRAIRRSRSEGVDLVVSSWPYGIGQSEHGYVDFADHAALLATMDRWAAQLVVVGAPNARYCVNLPLDVRKDGAPRPVALDGLHALRRHGLAYQTSIVWRKASNGQTSRSNAYGSLDSPNAPCVTTGDELILVLHKGSWNLGRSGEPSDSTREETRTWRNAEWTIVGATDKAYPHVFPAEVVTRCVKLFSFPGDLVADFHCGSGRVAIEAMKLGRRFVGGDVNPYAVHLSQQRVLEASRGQDG
jgi:DNA modification methylase